MGFDISKIKTQSEGNLVIGFITDKQEEVTYDVATINHENKDSGDSIVKIETDLVKANADLSTATIVLDSMAEGPVKESQRTKQMAATVRVRTLNERKASSGVVAYFGQEFDLDTAQHKISYLDQKKTEILALLPSLPA